MEHYAAYLLAHTHTHATVKYFVQSFAVVTRCVVYGIAVIVCPYNFVHNSLSCVSVCWNYRLCKWERNYYYYFTVVCACFFFLLGFWLNCQCCHFYFVLYVVLCFYFIIILKSQTHVYADYRMQTRAFAVVNFFNVQLLCVWACEARTIYSDVSRTQMITHRSYIIICHTMINNNNNQTITHTCVTDDYSIISQSFNERIRVHNQFRT